MKLLLKNKFDGVNVMFNFFCTRNLIIHGSYRLQNSEDITFSFYFDVFDIITFEISCLYSLIYNLIWLLLVDIHVFFL
jgi:hypothetical protein